MNIQTISKPSKQYPANLKEIASPPKRLYTCGELSQNLPLVAVVGSRKVTAYGREMTNRIVSELASAGVGIVSGLALGVDGYAHRAALKAGGFTIAVMACGLDNIYPSRHRDLAKDILKHGGGLVSEYEAGTPPLKQHFPARNRIISGLSQATLVIEAAEKSGALITASFALDQNRDVLAVPGNITNPQSQGTNNLIKAGAALVTNAEDILEELGLSTEKGTTYQPQSDEEQKIISVLKDENADAAKIIEKTGLDPASFNQSISLLEINGAVIRVGDKWVNK